MPLDSFANLQRSVMDWLARPDDPLISGAIPDMILMFEEEARDRLKTRFNEQSTTIIPPPNTAIVPLPSDFAELRELYVSTSYGNVHYTYQTPVNMDTNLYRGIYPYGYNSSGIWTSPDYPNAAYTIEGLNLRMLTQTGPNDPQTPINIVYMSGLMGLSDAVTSNWLLQQYPSLYLFGTLTMAEPYIGDDPRFQIWGAQREATFERIRLADRKARFSGGPLVIQTDVRNP